MFGRNKEQEPEVVAPAKPGGKGRPTPTRKEAEAAARARARAPRTKKEMSNRQRQVRMEESRRIRAGVKSGDEKYLPPRDQGPVRRFIRDFVDVRFSLVELVIPMLLITVALGYSGNPTLVASSSYITMAAFLWIVTDVFVLRWRLRKELARRFPEEPTKGTTYYAVIRALQMKFMRIPKAKVRIGQDLPEDYR